MPDDLPDDAWRLVLRPKDEDGLLVGRGKHLPLPKPTHVLPGPHRALVLAERVLARQQLWHRHDIRADDRQPIRAVLPLARDRQGNAYVAGEALTEAQARAIEEPTPMQPIPELRNVIEADRFAKRLWREGAAWADGSLHQVGRLEFRQPERQKGQPQKDRPEGLRGLLVLGAGPSWQEAFEVAMAGQEPGRLAA